MPAVRFPRASIVSRLRSREEASVSSRSRTCYYEHRARGGFAGGRVGSSLAGELAMKIDPCSFWRFSTPTPGY